MEMNKENARLTGWFVARDEDGELYLYDYMLRNRPELAAKIRARNPHNR